MTSGPQFLNRFVCFLDILGFSIRLETEDLVALHTRFAELIDEADRTSFAPPSVGPMPAPQPNFAYAAFHSDSVVLISRPINVETGATAAFNFIAAITVLWENGFGRQLPFRGCIGFGAVLYDEKRRIILSKSMPDLLRLEKRQNWAGCVVTRSAEEKFSELLDVVPPFTSASLLIQHRVPRKPPEQRTDADECLCINWVSLIDGGALARGLNFLTEPNRSGTKAFVDRVSALPVMHVKADPAMAGFTDVRFQASAFGSRVLFTDDKGTRVDPPIEFWQGAHRPLVAAITAFNDSRATIRTP